MSEEDPDIFTIAISGNSEALRNFLIQGGDLDTPDESGRSPLFKIVEKKNLNFLSLFLLHGADPYSQDKNGMNLLMKVSLLGDVDTLKIILLFMDEHRKHLSTVDTLGRNSITYAAIGQNAEMFSYLINLGLDQALLQRDDQGKNALAMVSTTRPTDIIEDFTLCNAVFAPQSFNRQFLIPLTLLKR